jgi:hypothetical protein
MQGQVNHSLAAPLLKWHGINSYWMLSTVLVKKNLPQTCCVGEITVLYTQLADEKLGVNCVCSIKTIALFLSTEYLA